MSEITKKSAGTCGMFFEIRHFLPVYVFICQYNSLFASFLQYRIVVWGFAYDVHIQPIFLVQKRIIRAIAFQSLSSPSSPIFSDIKILKLQELFQLKLYHLSMNVSIRFLLSAFPLALNQSSPFINMILERLLKLTFS